MTQQRRMIIGAPVILLALLAWLAGSARADGVVGYEQQTTTVSVAADGGSANVTAVCSSGHVVTGGGVDAGGTDDVKIYSSEPTNGASTLSDHSWNAFVRNDGTVAHNVTVTAICVDGSVAGYEQPTSSPTIAPSAFTDVSASCSAGHKVLGGGFRLETPDDLKPFSSQPTQSSNLSDTVWHMLVHNAGTLNRTMTLYAICVADTISGYEEPTNLVSVPAGTTANVTASCAPGNTVLGGGFQIETPNAVSVRSFAPGAGDGVASDHQWNVFAINEDPSNARQTISYAICAAPAVAGIATAVTQGTIALGDSFSDTATLSVPTGAPVTNGSVTFDVYGADDPSCTGDPVFTSGKALDGSTVATSDPFTPTSQGRYHVIASYSGDANYPPSQTACGDPGEQVDVGPPVPPLSTSVSSAEIALGATFNDTATFAVQGPAPTGTVTFDVFGPASSECSGPPLYSSTNPVVSGTATSDDFTGADAGDYEVIANYSGDTNYAATSTGCFDVGESVFVDQAALGIGTAVSQSSITLGDSFADTAALAAVPPGATPPTGSVTFDVFAPGDPACAGPAVFASTNPIDASGQATSDTFTPTSAGTFRVTASYGGDGNYTPAGSPCLNPGEPVSVAPATPTIATQVSAAAVPFGGSFSDTATLTPPAGEPPPTGIAVFAVYGPNDSSCTATPAFTSTKNVGPTGGATSDAFTPTAPGTYQVVATYGGDANYNPASTACADAAEAVVVGKVALPVSTQVSPAAIGLGASFHDTATLGTPPAGPPAPAGTVTFDVYAPADSTCAGPPVFTSTGPVVVAGTTSADFTPTAAGTYRVIARYSGDANYSPVASTCGDAGEQVAVARASLPLTTQVAPAQVTLGGSFHDTATLGSPPAGALTPTGSVTYRVYADAACASQVSSSTNPLGAASDAFTPTAAGTYRVVAAYSGDANYNASSTACGDAGETVTVGKATLPLTTQVAPAAITLGGSFHDTATLGSPPVTPTGSITFRVYSDAACATQVFSSTNPVGSNSDTFTPTAAGTYRVVAAYSGDANYNASSTACGDAGETVTVGKATLPLTTQVAPAAITLGGSFHDTATLGSPPVPPTGSITFRVYSDIACATQVSSSTNHVSGATAVSDSFTPATPGTLRVVAAYSGDANYNASASACGDAGEQEAVAKATVAIATAVAPASIALGASFHDTATLTGAPAGAPPPTGGVTFTVYADAACTNEIVSSTNPVTGATAVSGDFTPTAAGTYRVVASYGGDANYNRSSSACDDAGETVTVDRASLALTTQVAPAAIALGASFHDTATLGTPPAGAARPTGTVRFDVYGPVDASCASTPAFSSTNPVGAPSATFTPTAAGTYLVVARYSGDTSYTPSATSCGDPGETVTVARAAIGIATHVSPARVAAGSAFHDTATLGPASGPAPTGSVTFRVYAGATCATPVLSSTNPVANASATSDDFAPTAGTYRVVASYGGDANYAAATSACGDPTETVVVVPRPAITRINPRSGPEAGGNTVTITGSDLTGASSVHFGGATANFTPDSPTQITATAPPGSGTVGVTVTTPGGTSAPAQYTYNASLPPVVSGVAPSSGSTDGGSGVLVTGSNLGGATGIKFGAAAGSVLSVNPAGTRLVAITPPSTAGTVDVTVTTPFGTSPTNAADRYTYVVPPPPPTVTGLDPATGPAGTPVAIAGTNLGGATAVKFGALGATGFTVLSPTQITATAPAGSGAVDVTVTTPGGTSALGAADTFTYAGPPPGPGPPAPSTTGGAGPPVRQPAVQTGAPKAIDSTTEEFTATINPQGLQTTMHFEYTAASGAAANLSAITYAARTPEQVVGSDFADHTVTARVAGLVPNSDYHVRAVASNPGGTAASGDTAFTSATDPPPPPPVLGSAFNAEPVSGVVYVLLPGRGHVSQAHASAAKGVGFIPLTEARQLPVGTIFDTTAGTARLTTATATKGVTQSGSFASGLFKLLQNRKQKGLTELSLVLRPSAVKKCSTATRAQAQSAAKKVLPKTVLTLLRATAKGRFQTRGRYSSATVRGTSWTTSDRCDGTLTHVTRGVVVVTNIRRHRQIVLRAGKSYLAAKP